MTYVGPDQHPRGPPPPPHGPPPPRGPPGGPHGGPHGGGRGPHGGDHGHHDGPRGNRFDEHPSRSGPRETVRVVENSREWRYHDRRGSVSWLGNLFWLVFCGGLAVALVYYVIGLLFVCTIVLSPFGTQLLKLGSLALFPFGRKVVNVVADERSGMILASDAGCFEMCCCCAGPRDVEAAHHGAGDHHNHRGHSHGPGHGHDEPRRCCPCCCCCGGGCSCCGRGLLLCASIAWLPIGLVLAVLHLFMGLSLCCTVIGIPFGLQHFKLARLALCPFGKLDDNGLQAVQTVVQSIRDEPVYDAIPVPDYTNGGGDEDEDAYGVGAYSSHAIAEPLLENDSGYVAETSNAQHGRHAQHPPPLPPRK